jgi:DNA-binding transcriptional ArsR family regulator
MAGAFFQKDVEIKRVTTLGYQSAQALSDPVRIRILEILSHKQMNTEEITKVLRRSGYKKATTTIRHHLDTLKSAGLIEVTKMVGVRGVVMKYYLSTLRVFSYKAPELEKHSKLIDDISSKLLHVVKSMFEDKKFVEEFRGSNACKLCKADHYKEYVALEILNAALARILKRKDYVEMVSAKNHPKK